MVRTICRGASSLELGDSSTTLLREAAVYAENATSSLRSFAFRTVLHGLSYDKVLTIVACDTSLLRLLAVDGPSVVHIVHSSLWKRIRQLRPRSVVEREDRRWQYECSSVSTVMTASHTPLRFCLLNPAVIAVVLIAGSTHPIPCSA